MQTQNSLVGTMMRSVGTCLGTEYRVRTGPKLGLLDSGPGPHTSKHAVPIWMVVPTAYLLQDLL